MRYLLNNNIYWLLLALAWAAVLFLGTRRSLVRRYPLLFAFVVWDIGCSIGMRVAGASLDTSNQLYGYLYLSRYVLTTFFGHVILLWLYFQFGRPLARRDWHFLLAPSVLIAMAVLDTGHLSLFGWAAIAANALTIYIGLAVMWRMRVHPERDLGWNLKMVLLAFTVPAGFAAVVFMASSVGFPLDHDTSLLWRRVIALGFWVIVIVGVSEYSPPRLVEGPQVGDSRSSAHDEAPRRLRIHDPEVTG